MFLIDTLASLKQSLNFLISKWVLLEKYPYHPGHAVSLQINFSVSTRGDLFDYHGYQKIPYIVQFSPNSPMQNGRREEHFVLVLLD